MRVCLCVIDIDSALAQQIDEDLTLQACPHTFSGCLTFLLYEFATNRCFIRVSIFANGCEGFVGLADQFQFNRLSTFVSSGLACACVFVPWCESVSVYARMRVCVYECMRVGVWVRVYLALGESPFC